MAETEGTWRDIVKCHAVNHGRFELSLSCGHVHLACPGVRPHRESDPYDLTWVGFFCTKCKPPGPGELREMQGKW